MTRQLIKAVALESTLLLSRDDFVAACEHWEEAVKVAPLHEETWFAFGYAAVKKGDYDRALQAFSRSVQLEPTNAEALNNIAAIHIQRGNLQPAFVALQVLVSCLILF